MDAATVEKIKKFLGTNVLKKSGYTASGCINQGEGFHTDNGLVFIKKNNTDYAEVMFNSEMASLDALAKTKTIRVPQPIGVIKGPKDGTYYCILEFIEINNLRKFTSELGERLADLHLHNEDVAKNSQEFEYVRQFGFPVATCVGRIPVDNSWCDDWPTFYTRRLEEHISRVETKIGDKEAVELWSQLKPLIPNFFENIEVKPCLLHGDLWSGNVGETKNEPVIFDPGSVYGHHEFDLAMTTMFGRLGKKFYDSYHKRIPKAPGFSTREKLYHLFHYLNHWNHFGSSYRGSSISIMKDLIKTKFPLE